MTEEMTEVVEEIEEAEAADVAEAEADACECGCDHEHEHGECDCDDGCDCEEVFEIDVDEEDIIGYIYDEDDNEVGFIILDEDGEEVELFYAEDDECEYVEEEPGPKGSEKASGEEEYDLGITREGVAEATNDMNAIYKDGIKIAAEFKSTFDDISSSLDFLKKK